jgi:SNF2 family DNA or RNA helicase
LKRCSSHFDIAGSSTTALEKCDEIFKLREDQKNLCEEELVDSVAAAFRQRRLILNLHPGWKGTKKTEKGEVQDRLATLEENVQNLSSVAGGADLDINNRIKYLLEQARERKKPIRTYPKLAEANGEIVPAAEERLYEMKYALREHIHVVTNLGKELCGRIRSLRYFEWVRNFQNKRNEMECPRCSKNLEIDSVGVLSSCGHIGCLDCLNECATSGVCIEKERNTSCQARVNSAHIVSAIDLGADQDHNSAGKYGAKLSAVAEKVKEIIAAGDRLIVFVQFEDLKAKVREALADQGIASLQIGGTILQMMKAVEPFQDENPAADKPRVLLLKMDDEQSAGLNLTNLNHAIFVHPLLAQSRAAYKAYETQAIGRIRRYGQRKQVNTWRYLVRKSIDVDIYEERTGQPAGET